MKAFAVIAFELRAEFRGSQIMKNYSQLAMIGILVCGVVLSADALYFNNVNMYLANALVFMILVACSAYLLKLAHEEQQNC